MKWFALAFAAVWLLSKFYERASFALAVWINHLFRHDGKDATIPPSTSAPDVTESMRAGSPFAVDASNGPTKEVWNKDHTFGIRWLKSYDIKMDPDEVARIEAQFHAAEERRRLSGLTEIHRVNRLDPVVPPPSRSIRRSIH